MAKNWFKFKRMNRLFECEMKCLVFCWTGDSKLYETTTLKLNHLWQAYAAYARLMRESSHCIKSHEYTAVLNVRRGPNNPILQTKISIAKLRDIIESHLIRCVPIWYIFNEKCLVSVLDFYFKNLLLFIFRSESVRLDIKRMSAISQTLSQMSFVIFSKCLALRYADVLSWMLTCSLLMVWKTHTVLSDSHWCDKCCHITFHGPFHYWRT